MNKPMYESWSNKINVVESIRGKMSDDAKMTLANVLNNTDKALSDLRAIRGITNESVCRDVPTSQYAGVEWFPEHSIDMVSAIYASQIIDDIVSVQSIDSPVGVIRFLQYVYGQNRGTALKGDVAIDRFGAMVGAEKRSVACEFIDEEHAKVATQGTLEHFAALIPVRDDAYVDIASATKKLRARKKSENAWKVMEVDASGNEGTEITTATFTCDSATGKMVLTESPVDLTTANADLTISYFQDLSHCPTDSMNLELRLKTETIKAVPHKIRANISFDASYALSKAHGINIEESLINACTAEIRQERDNEVINLLLKQAYHSNRTWDRHVSTYISQAEHDQSFLSELFACATLINFETKRGFGNWVVVGRQGLNIIKSANGRFKSTGGSLPNNGAFVVGTIDDGDLKVIYSPYVPEDAYLVGYKGSDADAGFIVADFLPITKTELVMLDDFVGRQGLVSYYGTKMVNNKMYVSGKILNG